MTYSKIAILSVFITIFVFFFFPLLKNNPSHLAHEGVILWLKPLFLFLSFKFLFSSHALVVYLPLFWFYSIISFQWSGEEEKKLKNHELGLRLTLLTHIKFFKEKGEYYNDPLIYRRWLIQIQEFGEPPISPKKNSCFLATSFR